MTTFHRICIQNYHITDADGVSFLLHRGKEYLTSAEKDGTVVVFSQYWVSVPASIFAGEEPFT